jgi:hypothetical protein
MIDTSSCRSVNLMPRILILLLIVLGFSSGLQSSNARPPLEIAVRIILPEESICAGSKVLELEVYITNIGSRKVTISKELTVRESSFDVAYDMEHGSSRIATLNTRGDPFPDSRPIYAWITLSPRESRRYKSSLELRDRNFFTGPAFYTVICQYLFSVREPSGKNREMTVYSNEVLFEVKECPSQSKE